MKTATMLQLHIGTITHGKNLRNLSGNYTESGSFQDKISGHDVRNITDYSLHVRNVFFDSVKNDKNPDP